MYLELFDIILISIALAMDAFAVAITLGMSGLARKMTQRLKIAFTFGLFQGGLFVLGFFTLSLLGKSILKYNSIIAGIILAFLGVKMIKESFETTTESCQHEDCLHCKKDKCLKTGEYRFLTLKLLLIYGTATSIDAFAAGASYFGLKNPQITLAGAFVGIITFLFSYFGSKGGMHLKKYIGNKATILGGFILIYLAIKSFI